MRTAIIPDSDFRTRVSRLQEAMAQANLDVLVTYSSESEPASSRYLADFWPFFDFAGVVVPREGAPALITGGPRILRVRPASSRASRTSTSTRCSWSPPRPTGCRPSPTRTGRRS